MLKSDGMNDKNGREYLLTLGKKIRTARVDKNLSQQALADLCDIEKSNLSRMESGKINPTILTLRKISEQLFAHFHEIFEE